MGDSSKLVIKPFRQHVIIDGNQAQKIWNALKLAIGEIHNKNASFLSFEELYRNAYNLVLHKHGDLLYDGVVLTVKEHLLNEANNVSRSSDDQLLSSINSTWNDHKITMVMIRDILMYMDRTYVMQKKKTSIYEMGLKLFCDSVVYHEFVRERLQRTLLKAVWTERNGQLIDRSMLNDLLKMLVDIGIRSLHVYEQIFENEFLQQTTHFYSAESQSYLQNNTCSDYMKKVEVRLHEEQNRVSQYLHASTEVKLKRIVELELVEKHALTLIEMEGSGCRLLFRDEKVEDLARMYNLFSRIPVCLPDMRKAMLNQIKEEGNELFRLQEETKDSLAFVKGLLRTHEKFSNIVSVSFKNDKEFQRTLKESFESFINRNTKTVNYLAQYVDNLLRIGINELNEIEIDYRLEQVLLLFRYIQDKDIFENVYKLHLSKRLLSGKSISDEAERNMIAKLKAECGYQFTSKIEGMFTDMKMSKDTMDIFKKEHNRQNPIEIWVDVLTTGFWPWPSLPLCTFPPEISNCCKEFKSFYFRKHTGRRLVWQTNLGTADLRVNFSKSKHELSVSTYQMFILLLFNTKETYTYKEIEELTRIPEQDLRRHLISLCTPKYRVLVKQSKGKLINEDDSFTINFDFKSQFHRIRIPLVSAKETQHTEAIPSTVEEGRRHLIEASIVRIMKTRKSLQHNNLIAEVTRQLTTRFVPDPHDIKKRIENLIERDYLERSKDDRRVYLYIA